MITRRQFVQIVASLGVASQLPDLAAVDDVSWELPATPDFVAQFEAGTFVVKFCDGSRYMFNARVVLQSDDSLQVVPTGPVTVLGPSADGDEEDGPCEAREAVLSVDGVDVASISDIAPPSTDDLPVTGLRRAPFTFTLDWKGFS